MGKEIRTCYSEPIGDFEHFNDESPVVSGQSLTGAELFRRQSAGLPVGCALRQFNQVNPYLEKFSIYDSISNFRIRHGMLDNQQIENLSNSQEPEGVRSSASASEDLVTNQE